MKNNNKWPQFLLGNLGYTYGGLTGKTKEDFGSGKSFVTYMNIFSNSQIDINQFALVEISENESQNEVNYGDILFTTSSETADAVGMSSVVLNMLKNTYLNSFCFGFRLHNFNNLLPEYAKFLFRGEEVRKQITVLAQGSTRFNISKNALLKTLELTLPPLPEQQKIAQILSTVDEKIEVIEAKIVQTQELKKGLMQQLLTRGIGHTKFKNSELGEIPESWEVEKLSFMGEIISGGTPDTKIREYWDGDILWCTPTDITRLKGSLHINCTSRKISMIGLQNSSSTLLPPESLIICTRATIGDCAINKVPMSTNQGFKNIVVNNKVNVYFLYYMINYIKPEIIKKSAGSTFLEISKKVFENIQITLPPKKEQKQIATILTTVDEKLDVLQAKKENFTTLKKGLMQQLLTGKLRVTC